MIKITSFDELRNYFEISDEVISFMKSLTKDTEAKRYPFGETCYVNVQDCTTRTESKIMEAHEKIVDIQCLVDGEEKIYYTDKEGLTVNKPYSEKADYALYDLPEKADYALYDLPEDAEEITYKSGEGIILFPNDAHTPNVAVGEPRNNKKAVIKLNISCIKK